MKGSAADDLIPQRINLLTSEGPSRGGCGSRSRRRHRAPPPGRILKIVAKSENLYHYRSSILAPPRTPFLDAGAGGIRLVHAGATHSFCVWTWRMGMCQAIALDREPENAGTRRQRIPPAFPPPPSGTGGGTAASVRGPDDRGIRCGLCRAPCRPRTLAQRRPVGR
jgi:hypothetical protein